jgi:hypothetical protein
MAFSQIHTLGATGCLLEVEMRSSTTGQGLTGITFGSVIASYMTEGSSAPVSVTLSAMTTGSWVSGGWCEVNSTLCPGLYQFGIPNAALSSGKAATFFFQYSGALNKTYRVVLLNANLRDSVALGVSDIANSYANTQSLLSVTAATSGFLQRILSLVGDNQATSGVVLDVNSNPLSYVIIGYDTAAHAAANDGVTGVLNKVQVNNTYNSNVWVGSIIQRIT